MKNIQYILSTAILCICMTGFNSCIESGLDELPAYEDANITDVYFEYRYEVTRSDGVKDIKYIRMVNSKKEIDTNGTIHMEISIPNADGTFTESERAKVGLNALTGYCYLSNSARIEPVDGAPRLGSVGDFSSAVKYKVTAADSKTSKLWTISVVLKK